MRRRVLSKQFIAGVVVAVRASTISPAGVNGCTAGFGGRGFGGGGGGGFGGGASASA